MLLVFFCILPLNFDFPYRRRFVRTATTNNNNINNTVVNVLGVCAGAVCPRHSQVQAPQRCRTCGGLRLLSIQGGPPHLHLAQTGLAYNAYGNAKLRFGRVDCACNVFWQPLLATFGGVHRRCLLLRSEAVACALTQCSSDHLHDQLCGEMSNSVERNESIYLSTLIIEV